ncbi:MAG: murein biosynthesis integral membrane protein MurJ [Ktedonobacteraceae bacterium]|nr:murein biosynthesis integral membrane protein MurJ [Chloroflexota bacterium]
MAGEDEALEHENYWGVGAFRVRFKLSNLLPGGGFSIRRFSIAEAAVLLMMAYLASKGLGVVRQTIFNAIFGTGLEANAYYAAFRLPDTLFNLIAGGALTQAFIPVFVSYEREKGQREAWYLASLVFNVLLVALTFLILIGAILAPQFVSRLLVPGYPPAQQALTITLTRIMLIQPLILGLGTIATAILHSKRQFLMPAVSIAIYNIGLIGGLIVTLAIPRVGIYGPTFGVLAAAACQVAVQLPALRKQGVRYQFVWNLKYPGLREIMLLFIPSALAVGVAYVGFIAETAFTSYLPDPASLAALHNAFMLFALPISLVAQAISQAALPQMSSMAAAGQYASLRQLAFKVIASSILLSVPSAIALWLFGGFAIRLLFQHGAFTAHSTAVTTLALIGYAVGLPGVAVGDLVARSFYALKDGRTPLFTNIFALVVRIGLIVLLLGTLKGMDIILAIPLAFGGASTAEALLLCLLLFIRLRKKMDRQKVAASPEVVADDTV